MQKTYLIILYIALGFITILVIITKGQPVLVRRKIFLGLLILSLTAPAATLISCRTTDSKAAVQKDVWQTEGWVDGDTYRVRAVGSPKISVKNDARKKGTAREAAILMAKITAMENMKPCMIESCGGFSPYTEERKAFEMELGVIVKSGYVIAERYDADFNCEIMFEIKSPDIQKRIKASSNCY